ncbi:Thiol-disulfide oxidoreductase ResA [Sinobacterium norvegicum]|uniref:Thiol-disulfide oxidoreductase ResA n=1 Tax=Sinobacterium norvegicum TaxID=1641715 RepID=A0ABM9AI31_9GAMM|nr:protein disulfide oxidoreductase [Sinobacterium norvegicum]CAH0992898.1 Thiol-disulfide oxidoreductase ResA [Sinobacterium norvegicum]
MPAFWKQSSFWTSTAKTLVIICLAAMAAAFYQQRNMVSGMAPEINVATIAGERFNLSEQLSKGPVLVYFWGSWCPICNVVSPAVDTIADDYQVVTMALSSGDNAEVNQHLARQGYDFLTINDEHGLYAKQWGVTVTPSIFIINQSGEVNQVTSGITSSWGMRVRLWLAGLSG